MIAYFNIKCINEIENLKIYIYAKITKLSLLSV